MKVAIVSLSSSYHDFYSFATGVSGFCYDATGGTSSLFTSPFYWIGYFAYSGGTTSLDSGFASSDIGYLSTGFSAACSFLRIFQTLPMSSLSFLLR